MEHLNKPMGSSSIGLVRTGIVPSGEYNLSLTFFQEFKMKYKYFWGLSNLSIKLFNTCSFNKF